jgi:hypothetical protein
LELWLPFCRVASVCSNHNSKIGEVAAIVGAVAIVGAESAVGGGLGSGVTGE